MSPLPVSPCPRVPVSPCPRVPAPARPCSRSGRSLPLRTRRVMRARSVATATATADQSAGAGECEEGEGAGFWYQEAADLAAGHDAGVDVEVRGAGREAVGQRRLGAGG